MKWKRKLILGSVAILSFFSLVLFVAIFMADVPSFSSSVGMDLEGNSVSVSQATLNYRSLVEKHAKKEHIEDYINVLLAIIEVESGGKLPDVMQSSESKGLPPNTINDPEESIQQGVAYFAELVRSAKSLEADDQSVIQAYNYGGGFLNYVAKHGKNYSFELAESFSKEQAHGEKAIYTHPVAVNKNGG